MLQKQTKMFKFVLLHLLTPQNVAKNQCLMSTYTSNSTKNKGALSSRMNDRILTIDWQLLFRRIGLRFRQLFTSARHRVAQTEYTPPAWATKFRFSWFRLGLIAIALFVFTQKQVDFTVSVGKLGVSAGAAPTTAAKALTNQVHSPNPTPATQMSVIPGVVQSAPQSNDLPSWQVEQYDPATVRAYINRFARVAKTEEEKYGIPAAAKLAMAILESQAGTSPKTLENNNHFGSVTANGYYANAWNNWRAHSDFIRNTYPTLIQFNANYREWITALGKTNYSTDPQYGQKLLAIIQHYSLG